MIKNELGKDTKYLILRFGTIFGTRATGDNSIKRSLKQAYEDKKIIIYPAGTKVTKDVTPPIRKETPTILTDIQSTVEKISRDIPTAK